MKWRENLYIGDSVVKKVNKIKRKINHGSLTIDIYLICYPSNEDNLLDIIPANELLLKSYPKKDLYIIGLAKGYDEAVGLVQKIIEETVENTGSVKVRDYLDSFGGDR